MSDNVIGQLVVFDVKNASGSIIPNPGKPGCYTLCFDHDEFSRAGMRFDCDTDNCLARAQDNTLLTREMCEWFQVALDLHSGITVMPDGGLHIPDELEAKYNVRIMDMISPEHAPN